MVIRKLSALLVLAAITVAACGGDEPSEVPDEVTGVILGIDAGAEFGEVRSFELKDSKETYTIYIDPDRDYGFPLGHLNEHFQTSEAVRVTLEERDGKLYALEVDDT